MRALFLTSFIAATLACQQPVERTTPNTDKTNSTTPGTTPGTAPATPPGTPPANTEDSNSNEDSGDDSGDGGNNRVNAAYNESVEYSASTDKGEFAKVTVKVEEANDADYLNLQIAFTATRAIDTRKEQRGPGRSRSAVIVYPKFLVTLPAGAYKVGTHEGHRAFQETPPPRTTSASYHITLKRMRDDGKFRLHFKVLKSALNDGTLSNSFNLEFESPFFSDTKQFMSDNNETPSAGSFPRQ